jgi:hypothetical protein
MTAAASPRLIQTDWKTLYRAAILEPDRSVIRQKVSEAESAVLARARELFYSGGDGRGEGIAGRCTVPPARVPKRLGPRRNRNHQQGRNSHVNHTRGVPSVVSRTSLPTIAMCR